MSDIGDLSKVITSTVQSLVTDIADAQGISQEDFVLSVDSTLIDDYVIAIDAGYPPTLRVDTSYVAKSLFIENKKERKAYIASIKRKLALAISKVPRQQKTLALVPLGQAIALKKESRQFVRTLFPNKIHFTIPESQLQVTTLITVIAREVSTGMEVKLSGANESFLRNQAIAQLTAMVQDSDIFIHLAESAHHVPEHTPSRILINSAQDEDNVKYVY